MTGHERFMSALRREQPDRVPVWELIVNDPTLSAWGASDLQEFVQAEDLDGVTIFEDLELRSPTSDERLRAGGGERAHALAEPGSHDQRDFGNRDLRIGTDRERPLGAGHRPPSAAQAAARFSAGTFASNQARTGSSAGWARLRSR